MSDETTPPDDEGAATLRYLKQQKAEWLAKNQKVSDETWAEAIRTGEPLAPPPGYVVTTEFSGVATGSEHRPE